MRFSNLLFSEDVVREQSNVKLSKFRNLKSNMDNPEEILHCLEEFAKLKPKDIPRELEEYLSFVAKTGDPVYQWGTIKSLFREKLINVITELYESCPSVEIPPSPNVEVFNYEKMKSFILEKLDTFVAAPFTVQRICELLTTPRKEYNRIDKYMRALEKNILVVSTIEPGNRRTENGEGIVNGIESDHYRENPTNNDINVEDIEMEETPWPKISQPTPNINSYQEVEVKMPQIESVHSITEEEESHLNIKEAEPVCINTNENTIVERPLDQQQLYVSIEPVTSESCSKEDSFQESSVTITAVPAPVQKRRDSIEPAEQASEGVSSSDNQEIQENKVSTQSSTSETDDQQQYQEVAPSVPEVENTNSAAVISDSTVENAETSETLNDVQTANENVATSTVNQVDFPSCTSNDKEEVNKEVGVEDESQGDRLAFKVEETKAQQKDALATDLHAPTPESSTTIIEAEPGNCDEPSEEIEEEKDSSQIENALHEETSEKSMSDKMSLAPTGEIQNADAESSNPASRVDSSTELSNVDRKISASLEADTSDDDSKEGDETKMQEKEEEKEMDVDLQPQEMESKEENVMTE